MKKICFRIFNNLENMENLKNFQLVKINKLPTQDQYFREFETLKKMSVQKEENFRRITFLVTDNHLELTITFEKKHYLPFLLLQTPSF